MRRTRGSPTRPGPATRRTSRCGRATRRLGEDLLAAGRGNPRTDQKAALAVGFAFDALAPTNVLPGNPAALKKAFETGGGSVLAGTRNFASDLVRNGGRPRQVDTSSF